MGQKKGNANKKKAFLFSFRLTPRVGIFALVGSEVYTDNTLWFITRAQAVGRRRES